MIDLSNTIDATFRELVKKRPERTAIIFQDKEYSFAELNEMVEKIAAYLVGKGVKKQERAIIYLPHMPQWIGIWLALQRIGAVAVPVTHFYGDEELRYIGNDSGARIVFCADRNLEKVLKAAEDTTFDKIIVLGEEVKPEIKPMQNTAVKDMEIIPFSRILSEDSPPLPEILIESKDIAEILYTGGTTGLPKGVPLTNVLLLEAAVITRMASEPVIAKGEAVAVQGAPLNHIFGQEVGLGGLLYGDTLVLLPRMDLEILLSHIEKYKATIFFCTPTLCRMILEYKDVDKYDLSSLAYVFTAGEALPVEVARQWKERFNMPLYNGLGSTETCGGISLIPSGESFPEGTSGKVVFTKTVLLLDPDTGEPVSPGEPGELYVSSENMVTAYLNKPEETALHFVEMDGKMWYKTGDIVRIDKDGWLFFVDRSVDLIKHKGYRVAATRVEGALYKHPAVSECCVIGVPDAKVGEKVKGFVVLKAGFENVTAEELINWCSERLASYEVPAMVEFRETLPKTAVGKVLRRKIRDEERKKQETA